MKTRIVLLLLAFFCLGAVAQAHAAVSPKSFGVLPFKINGPDKYQYLSRGVQDMMVTRLHWPDHLLPAEKADMAEQAYPETDAAAAALRQEQELDYLIYGALTVMGENVSLDMTVLGPDKSWPTHLSTPMAELIPSLEDAAREINHTIFKRPDAEPEKKKEVVQLNPDLVYNETHTDQNIVALNPELRYQNVNAGGARLRSQTLQYAGRGMAIGDLDADGDKEVVIIEERQVHGYSFEQDRLIPVAEYEAPVTVQLLNVNVLDINRDGYAEVIVSAADDKNEPRSFMLNLKDGKFTEVYERIPLFLHVVRTPPDYLPTLIGQKASNYQIFERSVHEIIKSGGDFITGKRFALPSKSTAFGVAFLPQADDYKICVLSEEENLKILASSGHEQATTQEVYSGSAIGMEFASNAPGFGEGRDQMKDIYYVPMRMIPADLDKDGSWELLVNRPLSLAAQFFERYRYYPMGEIHALAWDGVGMSLLWKTRQIKGSVADFALDDANNDGMLDLCVLINTHPGIAGIDARRCMLLAYPLAPPKAE